MDMRIRIQMMKAKEENKEGFEFVKSRMLSLEFSQSLNSYHGGPKNFERQFFMSQKTCVWIRSGLTSDQSVPSGGPLLTVDLLCTYFYR
jgi:hypothetical protein